MIEKPRSVYQRGAQDGLIMGPLLALVVVLFGASPFHQWLFLPMMLSVASVPVLAFRMLRKSFEEDYQCSTFSTLWLHGICIFFFGGAIMCLISYVCMRWISPDYIYDMARLCVEMFKQSPDPNAAMWIKVMEQLIADGNLPRPADVVLELLYMAVLSGSLLSMFLSMLIRTLRRPTPPPYKQ